MTDSNSSNTDDNFCCGCCMGLAVGYLLLGSSGHAHGATLQTTQNYITQDYAIVQKVESSSTLKNSKDGKLLRLIEKYQREISPKIKEKIGKERLCKYTPSCSEYAHAAIRKHGNVKGSFMALERLARCNPLSKGRYDPVK